MEAIRRFDSIFSSEHRTVLSVPSDLRFPRLLIRVSADLETVERFINCTKWFSSPPERFHSEPSSDCEASNSGRLKNKLVDRGRLDLDAKL